MLCQHISERLYNLNFIFLIINKKKTAKNALISVGNGKSRRLCKRPASYIVRQTYTIKQIIKAAVRKGENEHNAIAAYTTPIKSIKPNIRNKKNIILEKNCK